MSADREQLRQQIAEEIGHEEWCHHDMDCCGCVCSDSPSRVKTIRRLAALVDQATADALAEAAEALHVQRFNADPDPEARWPEGSEQKPDLFYAGIVRARAELRARAAALRTHEGHVDA